MPTCWNSSPLSPKDSGFQCNSVWIQRLLFESNNSSRFFNWQSCSGMSPSIMLSLRNNLCRLSNPPNVDGMFPVKLLPLNRSKFKFFKEPIPIGIRPFIWLLPVTMAFSEAENFPIASGIIILKGLSNIDSSSKNLQLVNDARKLWSWCSGSLLADYHLNQVFWEVLSF